MPPFTRLTVPAVLLEQVIGHARAEAPRECCGLLTGQIADGVAAATARYAVENVAGGATEYETSPRHMLLAFRSMRESNAELLAIYHSHPTSAPVPSRRDIERNTYGDSAVHLIVGLAGAVPEVRGWWLTETGCRELPVEVVGG